jgi:hypothetical protein
MASHHRRQYPSNYEKEAPLVQILFRNTSIMKRQKHAEASRSWRSKWHEQTIAEGFCDSDDEHSGSKTTSEHTIRQVFCDSGDEHFGSKKTSEQTMTEGFCDSGDEHSGSKTNVVTV